MTVGEQSILASGTMVIENMEIPPRSLVVGIPGRVRGQTKERHLELIERTYKGYIEKGRRYKSQGDLEAGPGS